MESLEDIFFNARQIADAAGQQRYLAEACGSDNALREQVEKMLRDARGAEDFFGSKGTALVMPSTPLTEGLGSVIGRYKLLQKIGEGGMGVVYMAEQREPIARKVALKIVKLGMDTKQVVARFEAERQALALMDHPNIAKVLEAGATDTGRPYFVMELVRGIKITEYCDENHLSTSLRLDLFLKTCGAVQHAHQKGIIHRDLKPSNILVADHDGVPVPKIIDFGIAKATTGQPLTDKTLFTEFEQFIGTPAYMSPEQAKLSGLDIDTRTDIYSLGVLLYELLTGQTPFDPQELLAAGLEEMRRTIREVEPVKPSTRLTQERQKVQGKKQEKAKGKADLSGRSFSTLNSQLSTDLDWIVMKCLEKDRSRRYETANGLAADIQRHLNCEVVFARPPSRLYEFQKTVRRHKFGFAAAGVVAVALVLGMVGTAWQAVRARAAEKKATRTLAQVATERDAKEQARQDAEAVSGFLYNIFRSPNPYRDGRSISVAETLDKAVKELETSFTNQPDRRAMWQKALGRTYFNLGLYREAILLQEKALDYYQAKSGVEHPNTLAAKTALAVSYFFNGREVEALKMQEEVLALRRKAPGPEHPTTLSLMQDLANSYDACGRKDEALTLREELVKIQRKLFGTETNATLSAMGNLAISYQSNGRTNDALKLREEVVKLERKVLGPEHPDTLLAMGNLANSYDASDRRKEGLQLREELLKLEQKVLGPEHPETVCTMIILVARYYGAERLIDAEPLYRATLEAVRRAPPTYNLVHDLSFLAGQLRQQKRLPEAESAYRAGLNLCRQLAQTSEFRPRMAARVGSMLRDQGKWAEAEPFCREAVTNSAKLWPNDFPKWEWQFNDLVDVLRHLGKTGEVERLQETYAAGKLR